MIELMDFIDTSIRLHPVYLAPFLLIVLVLFLLKHESGHDISAFWRWVFPKEIYFHPSHLVDLKLFIMGRIVFLSRLFDTLLIQTGMTFLVMHAVSEVSGLQGAGPPLTSQRIFLTTLIMTVVTDFGIYWAHRLHHERSVIWPFHAVHHSAEVLTPVTVYRKHPVYDLISHSVNAVLMGLIQGVLLVLLIGEIRVTVIAGINAFYFVFNVLGSNLRHSHIWLSYGFLLEHVFISPAQHQIHHSLNPKHHNKNYGEILAVWDWIFGTLYIPRQQEMLQFGISESGDSAKPMLQPHPTLRAALLLPFQESLNNLKKQRRPVSSKDNNNDSTIFPLS